MAAAAPVFINMMEDWPAWRIILGNFGLAVTSIDRFVEDYETANDAMASSIAQITSVVDLQNKIYRAHATVNQR